MEEKDLGHQHPTIYSATALPCNLGNSLYFRLSIFTLAGIFYRAEGIIYIDTYFPHTLEIIFRAFIPPPLELSLPAPPHSHSQEQRHGNLCHAVVISQRPEHFKCSNYLVRI